MKDSRTLAEVTADIEGKLKRRIIRKIKKDFRDAKSTLALWTEKQIVDLIRRS